MSRVTALPPGFSTATCSTRARAISSHSSRGGARRPPLPRTRSTAGGPPRAYIWAYYDTALFTKKAVPEAEGYSGSMENHCHVGLCKDTETAERDGPLQVTATIG